MSSPGPESRTASTSSSSERDARTSIVPCPPARSIPCFITRIAEQKRATPAQVALAWLLGRKPWIVPIPATTKLHRLEENLGGADVHLRAEDLQQIEDAAPGIEIQGARYSESSQRMMD